MDVITRKYGPLPGWAWLLIVAGIAYFYLEYRKKKQASTAAAQQTQQTGTNSSTPNVPVSNLTTAAQPMPIQLGDTFVDTGTGSGVSTTSGSPVTTVIGPTTASNSLPAASVPQPSPAVNVGTIC